MDAEFSGFGGATPDSGQGLEFRLTLGIFNQLAIGVTHLGSIFTANAVRPQP